MNAQQWQTVKEIFGEALEVPPRQRREFIDSSCSGNHEVRREVEKLLSSFDDEYMQESAILEVAKQIENEQLEIGEIIGHYKIEQLLGSGGMGEVYLARDLKLNRHVAVKVLPPDSAFNPSAGKRLIREAQAAAALDHPNIGTIYEVGDADGYKFIVMQYLRGETLAERIGRGRIPVGRAVEIAIQIADALSAAHAQGVTHRDIKPSNVMIDNRRNVKVLDFSLAKKEPMGFKQTADSLFSQPGLIFGTIAYMSPEQARGNPIDFRTDIWSFGVVLYEMLTGRTPFRGATTSDTLAAILRSDVPPMNADGAGIPAELESIVLKALEKDVADRHQTIDDMLFELKGLALDEYRTAESDSVRVSVDRTLSMEKTLPRELSTGEIERVVTYGHQAEHRTGEFTMSRIGLWAASAFAAVIIGAGSWYFWQNRSGSDKPPVREAPSVSQFFSWKRDPGEDPTSAAEFSPDGKLIAFASTRNGVSAVWLKQVAGGEAFTHKKDHWPETSPIFSPDGERIAFLSNRGNEVGIWSIPTLGGNAELLGSVDVKATELLDWSDDGQRIIFGTLNALFSLELTTKRIEKLAHLDLSHLPYATFAISPDRAQIAYTDVKDGRRDIWVTGIDGGQVMRVTDDDHKEGNIVWHPDGRRILFDSVRNEISQIFACGIDGDSPVQVLSSDVPLYLSGVSPDGTKVLYYSQRDDADLWNVRIDDSQELRLTDTLGIEMWADPAPDGQNFIYQRSTDASRPIDGSTIVLQSLDQERSTREFSKDGFLPIWSPDGTQIAFLRSEGARSNLWVMPASGGEPMPLTSEGVMFAGYGRLPFNRLQTRDYQWSPDSRSIVFSGPRGSIPNLWKAAANGTGVVRLTENLEPGGQFFNPAVSPAGDRVAFLRFEPGNATPKSNRRWSVWVHDSDSASMRYLFGTRDKQGIVGWTVSGGEVIIKSSAGVKLDTAPVTVDLYGVSADGGAARHLHRLTETYFTSMVLSPDGTSLAFVKREEEGDSIHVMSLNGREDGTILKNNDQRIYFANLTWAPDGRSIYFGKQANWQVISIMGNFK